MDRNGVSITLPKVQPPTVDELRSRVSSLCARYSVQKLEVFGSVAEGTAKAGSDVDLMVTFQLNTEFGIEFFDMKLELEELLGCPVDLLERKEVESMENWILCRSILRCVKTVYAA
jgi:predicted nucleotidyltransferase